MKKLSGYLMIIIAILLVMLAGLATSFVSIMVSGTNSSTTIAATNSAYDLAMSGIENGLYQLSLGNCSSSWSSSVSVGNQGSYQYNCTPYNATAATSSAVASTDTTINLTTSSGFASFGSILIDSEIIYYDSISGNSLLNAQRGNNGTSPASHTLGTAVTQSQYIIGSQGGVPSLTAPFGQVTLSQATLNNLYFVAGSNASGQGVILTYNGVNWLTSLTVPSTFGFQGMYTASPNGQAVGYPGALTSTTVSTIYQYNGSTWSSIATSSAGIGLNNVSCDGPKSPTNCWSAGATSASHNFLYNLPNSYTTGGNNSLFAISCNNGACATVGAGNAYNFPSTSASPYTTAKGLSAQTNDVDCPALNSCIAVQNSGAIFYYNGTWGSKIQLKNSSGGNQTQNLLGVDCPSTSVCFIVGASGIIYKCPIVPSAATCVLQALPGGATTTLSDVTCISTTDCLAVSSTSGTTAYRYNGTSWTAIALPASYSLNTASNGSNVLSTIGLSPTVFHNQ